MFWSDNLYTCMSLYVYMHIRAWMFITRRISNDHVPRIPLATLYTIQEKFLKSDEKSYHAEQLQYSITSEIFTSVTHIPTFF